MRCDAEQGKVRKLPKTISSDRPSPDHDLGRRVILPSWGLAGYRPHADLARQPAPEGDRRAEAPRLRPAFDDAPLDDQWLGRAVPFSIR